MSATEHILVVDDDGDVRDVLVDILRDRGYRVSLAVDGPSMREFLQDDAPVDAVVLDAAMPGEASVRGSIEAQGRNGLLLTHRWREPDSNHRSLLYDQTRIG
jgi:CheY-like chemotaxis protein